VRGEGYQSIKTNIYKPIGSVSGFTVVELIVVMSMIGVLIAITAPAIGGARRAALEAAVLAHQTQVGGVLRSYVDDHDNTFPFYGIPGTNDAKAILAHHYNPAVDPKTVEPDHYWSQMMYWALFLQEEEGYDRASMAMTGPEFKYKFDGAQAKDWLTATAWAPPHCWTEAAAHGPQDQNVQRWDSVAYPSSKGILMRQNSVKRPTEADDLETFVWFADGHDEHTSLFALRPGTRSHANGQLNMAVLFTEYGLRGRDK